MNDGYTFRLIELGDADLEQTSALLRQVFRGATHLTTRYLRWQYGENPDGPAVGCNAYAGGELVGTMAAVPMAGRLDGEPAPGLFMLNGAVQTGHRGRKLQSRISAAIFEEAAGRGFRFCFGTGNKYSTGPLLTRFRMVKPLEARIGLGSPAIGQDLGTPSFERAWTQAAKTWRLANPERPYKVRDLGARSLVTAATGIPGLEAVLYDGREPWPTKTAASASPALRLWIGLDPQADWSRSPYFVIPKQLRSSPLNLVFKDLTGGSYMPDPDRLVFRAADFDPY